MEKVSKCPYCCKSIILFNGPLCHLSPCRACRVSGEDQSQGCRRISRVLQKSTGAQDTPILPTLDRNASGKEAVPLPTC